MFSHRQPKLYLWTTEISQYGVEYKVCMGFSTRHPWSQLKITILNKNGLRYAIRVLFAAGGVIISIYLDLRNFFESGFSLHKEIARPNTLVKTACRTKSKLSQAKMALRPQIHRRIQGQRLIFHFNYLATPIAALRATPAGSSCP